MAAAALVKLLLADSSTRTILTECSQPPKKNARLVESNIYCHLLTTTNNNLLLLFIEHRKASR